PTRYGRAATPVATRSTTRPALCEAPTEARQKSSGPNRSRHTKVRPSCHRLILLMSGARTKGKARCPRRRRRRWRQSRAYGGGRGARGSIVGSAGARRNGRVANNFSSAHFVL